MTREEIEKEMNRTVTTIYGYSIGNTLRNTEIETPVYNANERFIISLILEVRDLLEAKKQV